MSFPTEQDSMSFDRRQFMGMSALTGVGIMTSSVAISEKGLPVRRNAAPGESKKVWAKNNLRGGESFVMTSMQPDLKTLDEEGIRHDVRHAIAQGFCSILPLTLGIDANTDKQFQE